MLLLHLLKVHDNLRVLILPLQFLSKIVSDCLYCGFGRCVLLSDNNLSSFSVACRVCCSRFTRTFDIFTCTSLNDQTKSAYIDWHHEINTTRTLQGRLHHPRISSHRRIHILCHTRLCEYRVLISLLVTSCYVSQRMICISYVSHSGHLKQYN